MTFPTTSIAATSAPKTVYFIRHAESEENRRLASMKTVFADIGSFAIPKASDFTEGLRWFDHGNADSDVSERGKEQITEMAAILGKADFLNACGIEMVVHSPLVRAKETCKGILECAAPDVVVDPVKRVVELDLMIEKTLTEWSIAHKAYQNRLKDLEKWLSEQSETKIVLVGHSQFFKSLLGLDFKFGNCDVWKSDFDYSLVSGAPAHQPASPWSKLEKLYACEQVSSRDGEESSSKT